MTLPSALQAQVPQRERAILKVGILCECSGIVRDAFLARGHDAISCDLKPTRRPGPHRQGDLWSFDWTGFDLLICHPECTYLTSSAEWAYGDGPYHQKVKPGTLVGKARREAREQQIEFVKRLYAIDVPHIAIENPTGALSSAWRKPDQIIQPYQFGDDASKATAFWLKGLPTLKPTGLCMPRIVADDDCMPRMRWGNQTDGGQNRESPGEHRAEIRSNTFPGVAAAMAQQWGDAVALALSTPAMK